MTNMIFHDVTASQTEPALPDTVKLLLSLSQSAKKEEMIAIAWLYTADRFFRNYLSQESDRSDCIMKSITESLDYLSVLEDLDNLTERLHNLRMGYEKMRPLLEELKNNIATAQHGQ